MRGYPTIKYFAQGTKKDAEEYDGGRTTADITQWALSRFEENLPAPEVTQVCVCCRTDSFSRYFLLIWKEFFDGFSSLCDVGSLHFWSANCNVLTNFLNCIGAFGIIVRWQQA